MTRKGTNLAHKGKYSSTLMEPLRIRARASSNHYSLVRPAIAAKQHKQTHTMEQSWSGQKRKNRLVQGF